MEGAHVAPLLEEDEAVLVLDVAVHRVQKTTGLLPRAPNVFEADLYGAFERIGSNGDASGDDDHDGTV